MTTEHDTRLGDRDLSGLLGALGLALLAGIYFVLRPGGLWAESDTGSMALAIRAVQRTGQLAPNLDEVYGNGYGYQAVSIAILGFTGLSVQTLQQVVYPVISALLVLPVWALYRELTGSGRIATLATLLLLLVPEHLFAVLRGSHERLDRVFMLTALWMLVRAARIRTSPVQLAAHVVLMLTATYGLIATNALFGMSFILAITTALLASAIGRIGPKAVRPFAAETIRLLGWLLAAALVLLGVMIFFVYPPVDTSLRALSTLPAALLAVILNGGPAVNAYAGVLGAWVSPLAYLVLSMADFLVLGVSALIWLRVAWSWLRGASPPSLGMWFLFIFYAAFALQGVAGIVSDRSGTLQGNVQYRAFSIFATMAAPLLASTLSRWRPRRVVRGLALGTFAIAALCAMVKVTLDPAVSNKWLLYTTDEMQAMRWADTRQQGTDTWTGHDERLSAAYDLVYGLESNDNRWDDLDPEPGSEAYVVSDMLRIQSSRLGKMLPPLGSLNVVYDNGTTQVYRLPALAAFDR